MTSPLLGRSLGHPAETLLQTEVTAGAGGGEGGAGKFGLRLDF